MNGYNFVHNYRSDRLGGGVGLYLSSDLQYKFRNDLGFPEQSCVESLFIEIVNGKGNTLYRVSQKTRKLLKSPITI
jgi:hypothetical protein